MNKKDQPSQSVDLRTTWWMPSYLFAQGPCFTHQVALDEAEKRGKRDKSNY